MKYFVPLTVGLVILAFGSSASAQTCNVDSHSTPYPERTVSRPHQSVLFDRESGHLTGGHVFTWDGLLYFQSIANTRDGNDPNLQSAYIVRAVRPQKLKISEDGKPNFSEMLPLVDPNSEQIISQSRLRFRDPRPAIGIYKDHAFVAVTPDTKYPVNPFRSDVQGNPNAQGAYHTYHVNFFMTEFDFTNTLGRAKVRVVVQNLGKENARVVRSDVTKKFRALRSVSGVKLRGFEPTLTNDGHLLIWSTDLEEPSNPREIMYSYNRNANAVWGWSDPKPITALYYLDRNVRLGGLTIAERYPLARRPLRDIFGRVLQAGDGIEGNYNWVSLDGSELFYSSIPIGNSNVKRFASSVIGRWTGWGVRHLDGPINADRSIQRRFFLVSPGGATPGLWAPFKNIPNFQLPYTGEQVTYPLFESFGMDYHEVSFFEHESGEFELALDMNEAFTTEGNRRVYDLRRTPDISGNFNTGNLIGNSGFSNEFTGESVKRGKKGQSIYFPLYSYVNVPAGAGSRRLSGSQEGVSVDFWIQGLRTIDYTRLQNRMYLFRKPGSYQILLNENGRWIAEVFTANGTIRLTPNIVFTPGEWTHIALTYNASTGKADFYLDAQNVASVTVTPSEIVSSGSGLNIGPHGNFVYPPGGLTQPFFAIDQVRVSKVPRSLEYIQKVAHQWTNSTSPAPELNLPVGLNPLEAKIPADNPITESKKTLGQALFFDTNLSRSREMSCATCHKPELAFTDGLITAVGSGGQLLPRNTPTILNRLFSTHQFFDGKAQTLESQVTMPIEDPKEMNLTLPEAVTRIQSNAQYATLFSSAFGSEVVNVDRIQKALATYVRAQIVGGNRVDRYESGELQALSQSEIRGRALFHNKARCAACHFGSNYSDELFHNTGFSCDTDLGREQVTGNPKDRRAFKTPTLRKANLTAPYLHDGSVSTLEELIDLYASGGRFSENKDSEIIPFILSDQERTDLIQFVRALGE